MNANNSEFSQTNLTNETYKKALEDWKNSGISDDVIDLNLKFIDGFQAFDLFISNCELGKDDRLNSGKVSGTIARKYNHLYEGYWYVETFNPLTGDQDFAQCKPFKSRGYTDEKGKAKTIKYETPKGAGTPFIYLDIPFRVIKRLAKKHKIADLPNDNVSDKWQWIKDNPQIEIYITEGVKKAAALISIGKVAIASVSITTHSEKATEDEKSYFTSLKPELLWMLESKVYDLTLPEINIAKSVLVKKSKAKAILREYEQILAKYNKGKVTPIITKDQYGAVVNIQLKAFPRKVNICFDRADDKEESRNAVNRETQKLGQKLTKQDCEVFVVNWKDQQSKGIDDYLVNHGVKETLKLLKKPITFKKFDLLLKVMKTRKLSNAIEINQRYLSADLIMEYVANGKQIIGLKSQQNTGKTATIAKLLRCFKGSVLNITHRQTLSRSLADRLGIGCYLDDDFKLIKKKTSIIDDYSLSICIDSLLQIPEDTVYKFIILDEIVQIIWHSLSSRTEISKNRFEIISRLFNLIQNCLDNGGNLILSDADLDDISVEFFVKRLRVKKDSVVCFNNLYEPFSNRKMFIYKDAISLRKELENFAKQGKRIIIHTSGQKVSSTHGSINLEQYLLNYYSDEEIYRIDQESISLTNRKEVGITDNLTRLKDAKIIIYTNTVGTGVSLDVELVGEFDAVFGIFFGNYAIDEFEQGIERYRGDCDRHIFIAEKGCTKIGKGDSNHRKMKKYYNTKLRQSEIVIGGDLYRELSFDASLIEDYCLLGARINNDLQVLKDAFIIHEELKGYQITENVISSMNREEKQELSDCCKDIKTKTCTKEANEVFSVNRVDEKTIEEIRNKKRRTHEENLLEKREKLHRKYGDRFMEFLDNPKILIQFYHNEMSSFQFGSLYLRFLTSLDPDQIRTVDKVRSAKRIAYNSKNEKTEYFLDVAELGTNTYKRNILKQLDFDIDEIENKVNSFDYNLMAKFEVSKSVNGVASIESQDLLDQLMEKGNLISNSQIRQWSINLDELPESAKHSIDCSFGINLSHSEGKEDKHIVRYGMFLRRLGYGLESIVKTDKDNPIKENYYRIVDNAIGSKLKDNEVYQEILQQECRDVLGKEDGDRLYKKSFLPKEESNHIKKQSIALSDQARVEFWEYLHDFWYSQLTNELVEFEQWELVA